MTLKAIVRHRSTKAAFGGALVALLGWQLCWLPMGESITHFSYDLPSVLVQPATPTNVVLIEMDEVSHLELRQNYGERWDRRLHARLLNHLRADGASVVVFDIVFSEPGSDESADRELAESIRAHGRVVLAADADKSRRSGILSSIVAPTDILRDATTNWGPAQVDHDSDNVVRRIYGGTEQKPAMVWIASTLVSRAPPQAKDEHLKERWVRYYGPGETLPHVSYSQAVEQPAGFYRGKIVFIGGRPKTRFVTEEVDEFLTPWRLHGQPQISGLELTATEFLNLSRGDFLRRLPIGTEITVLVLIGILAGAGLSLLRPIPAVAFALVAIVAVISVAFVLFLQSNLWFGWAVVLVQVPGALAWSLAWHWAKLKKEKDWLEAPLPDLWDDLPAGENIQTPPAVAKSTDGAPVIPDYDLVRLVGRGAYGDVWLARDIVGGFRAIKIVRRVSFDHAGPYEREFRGLQKFSPVSRRHPGLVQILHVGQDPHANYFYYVMEAGDDETSGPAINPDTYTPRNLGRDLHRRAPLPAGECIEIMSTLCDALEFLHGEGLIHRDIKPANVIFVNGRAKLADVGLVTDINEQRQRVSLVGTEGYLPPEGPGTVSGDVFAMGKVLSDMLRPFSADPTRPGASNGELQAIVNKACAANAADRFASIRDMHEALLKAKIAGGNGMRAHLNFW